jgi:hypothetical protein
MYRHKNICKHLIIQIWFICLVPKIYSQNIDVTETTLKIPSLGEETLYYGFAEGDQIIFNFQEMDNKEMKEVEVFEYPSNSKFMDYKSSRIENKNILVSKTGVYGFRLKNSAVLGRICKIKIQRIAASEKTKLFNSSIKWVDKSDTTWNTYTKDVVVGYDTIRLNKTKKELVKTENVEELIMDKSQRVHSTSNSEGNKTHLFFSLPQYESNDLIDKKVISWAYWVGVGEEANQAWKQNAKLVSGLVKGVASYVTTPLGGLLVGTVTELMLPNMGEDVAYGIVDSKNKDLFYAGMEYRGYDFGKGIAGYKKFTNENMLSGTWFIVLSNDNVMQGIDANVKVVTLIETKTYDYRPYIEQKITAVYEKKIFKDPVITTNKIPVND